MYFLTALAFQAPNDKGSYFVHHRHPAAPCPPSLDRCVPTGSPCREAPGALLSGGDPTHPNHPRAKVATEPLCGASSCRLTPRTHRLLAQPRRHVQTALVHVSSRPKNTSGVESVPGVAVGPCGATAARGPSLPGVETCSGQTCPAAPTHPPLSRPPGQPETCPLDSFRGALLPQTRRLLVVFWQALT